MGEGRVGTPGGACPAGGGVYRRRQTEGTLLYRSVQENLATFREEAAEVGRGLPRHVVRDFTRYLECGVLAHGFARVWCGTCRDDLLVAFSCKGRGVCPSCNARRAHVTAAHLVERVLPHVPYRQWTLSFPHRVRWVLLRDAGLLSEVLTVFLRAVFALQKRRARRLGTRCGQTGASRTDRDTSDPFVLRVRVPTRLPPPPSPAERGEGRVRSGCSPPERRTNGCVRRSLAREEGGQPMSS